MSRYSRFRRHPEAVAAASLAEREKKRADLDMPTSWHWPYGWVVRLFAPDGSVHTRYTTVRATYGDAVTLRDEEMASGRYEKAWLERLEAQSP